MHTLENRETQRRLEAITDPGLFERLAAAVLREADWRTRLLIHPGVNLDGKTVRSPLDGITFVENEIPPQMIAVHHTTCKREDLAKKWLHDPDTVKPSKGGTPTAPPGDLVKTSRLFFEQQQKIPNLRARLILTTNKEPPEVLVRDVHAAAHAAGLEVTIWPNSVLAHFLDYDPTGQWIRSRFLQIDQEHLSEELFHELSRRSLGNTILLDDSELWIDRQLDRTLEEAAGRDVVFLVAESGLGKSVACYKRLAAHVEAGGFGLIIQHDVLASTSLLEQAIETTLRRLHPSLVCGAGSEACALASERKPLMMVVEDINKSGRPKSLIERLASWSTQRKDRKQDAGWQILCPVWPRILTALGDEARRSINSLVLAASSFTVEEGTAAVQRRSEVAGIPITRLNAEAVASALAYDPLLIALQSPATAPDPDRVIQAFIEASLERLAEGHGEFTAGEYRQTLSYLAATMLERRCLGPTMTDVAAWLSDTPDTVTMLRHIAHFREIIRVTGSVSDRRLAFRHDRVRDWLHADAVANLMRVGDLPEAVLMEPYFSGIIGAALVREGIPLAMVDRTAIANPLSLFCAMRLFGEPTNDLHYAVLKAAEGWLDEEATHLPNHDDLRWTACRFLSECEASYVKPLVQSFRNEKDDWWGLRARFRNGDFAAGIILCAQHEPGIGVVGHLELIDHVERSRGVSLVTTLDSLLRRDELPPDGRVRCLEASRLPRRSDIGGRNRSILVGRCRSG